MTTTNRKQFLAVKNISEIQQIFTKLTGQNDVNKALQELIIDYIRAKEFQLSVQNTQYEIKWRLSYSDFETESAKWENGASYEIEQEYYNWREIISELAHLKIYQKNGYKQISI